MAPGASCSRRRAAFCRLTKRTGERGHDGGEAPAVISECYFGSDILFPINLHVPEISSFIVQRQLSKAFGQAKSTEPTTETVYTSYAAPETRGDEPSGAAHRGVCPSVAVTRYAFGMSPRDTAPSKLEIYIGTYSVCTALCPYRYYTSERRKGNMHQ